MRMIELLIILIFASFILQVSILWIYGVQNLGG